MKTIIEIRNNNEIQKGIYYSESLNQFMYLTPIISGVCNRLTTAADKINLKLSETILEGK